MFKGFQKPKRLVANTETLTERYGMFTAQPFQRVAPSKPLRKITSPCGSANFHSLAVLSVT